MKRSLFLLTGIFAAALVAALGIMEMGSHDAASNWASVPIGGPFQLTSGDGRTVTDASFRGKWMLVYFGYTHCPDACPTALSDIAGAFDKLTPAQRADATAVFITVDPERDTPAVMKDYVAGFGDAIQGLSGSPEAIEQAEKEYRVYAAKHPTGNGDYEMDHSSIIYVMNPQGRFVAGFTHENSPDEIATKLKQLGA